MRFSLHHQYFLPLDGSGVVVYSRQSGSTHFLRGAFTAEIVQAGKSIDALKLQESLGLNESSINETLNELLALGIVTDDKCD